DELRALLVLADREQNGADRRRMKPRQRVDATDAEGGDEHVIDPRIFEVDAKPARARDTAEAVLAAGKRGPSVGHGIGERRERERQQGKIDATPAQHEKADEDGRDNQKRKREQRRPDDRTRKPVTLRKRDRVGTQAEPGAMTKRDEAGVPDQDVESHARHGKEDDIGGAGQRETTREERKRQ